MAKPKLCLIPSSQGDKFYSVLPSSGVGDFDFSRSGGATRINSQGLIETVVDGVSRLNYPMIDGKVVGCPSHLLEPQSTNIALRSQELGTSPWVLAGGAVTNNSAISPDGTLNANKIESVSATLAGGVFQTLTSLVTGDIYTVSFYGKSGTSANLCLTINNTAAWNTVGGKVFTSADGLNNSTWTRFEYTFAVPSTSGFNIHIGAHSEVGLTPQYLGDFYVYGLQAEKSSHKTSYIPTTTSAVTRSAETANNSGDASTFNDSEGVLMAEISALANDLTNRGITISDGSVNNRVTMFYTNVSNSIQVKVVVGGSNSLNSYIVIPNISLHNKFALKYKQNDFSLFVNGFELITDTSGNTFSNGTLTKLAFDRGDAAEDFYGKTKEIGYYDTALTDEELEYMTSYRSLNEMVTELNLNAL